MELSTKSISQSLNLYSIFGYLLPGFFLTSLLIIDYDFTAIIRYYDIHKTITLPELKTLNLKVNYILNFFSTGTMSDFKFIPFLIYIFFCYLLGHIVSAISSLFLERFFIKGGMGYPSTILLSGIEPKYKFFFGNYRRPFKYEMITNVKNSVNKKFGFNVNVEDYYWLCYSYIITARPYLAARVHHFVNLYGFSRNIAAAIFIYLFTRLVFFNWILGSTMDYMAWRTWLLFLLCGSFMFWNYLKLFKRQALDIYFLFLSILNDSNSQITVESQEE